MFVLIQSLERAQHILSADRSSNNKSNETIVRHWFKHGEMVNATHMYAYRICFKYHDIYSITMVRLLEM